MSRSLPLHPSGAPTASPTRLYGRRVMLRPLVPTDFEAWSEVRVRNGEWLTRWEPRRPDRSPDPGASRDAFTARCHARERERIGGLTYAFGIFVDNAFSGEINLNNVQRGAMQSATIGYWIDRARAGNAYMAEAVVVVARHAFDDLQLHRIEVCIVPRNGNSRRVMEKLGFREEGLAERFLEIDGVWEDHVRYGFTEEEWRERRTELTAAWL